jgi:predicted XRE-type DNA-binding protein
MDDRESTVRSRELGIALRRAMRNKGLIAKEIAQLLQWQESKVSRLLSGKTGTSLVDVAAFLAICGVTGPRREELLNLAKHAHEPGWCQEYDNGRPPIQLTTLCNHEDVATTVTSFDTASLPRLLQTVDYLRAHLHTQPLIPDEEIEKRVSLGMQRQGIFDRHQPAMFRFFIEEHALTRTGHGAPVMSEQVHHLLRMAVRPRVEIRVIPQTQSIRECSPFTLMDFADLNPVAHVEYLSCSLFVEQKDSIATYRHVVANLDTIALDRTETRTWLVALAETQAS